MINGYATTKTFNIFSGKFVWHIFMSFIKILIIHDFQSF